MYVFEPPARPTELRPVVGGRVRERLIRDNWPGILQLAASPRRNDLASALREVGRVERTLFMIDWALDPNMQRRAQLGLNKGESHHALKNALRIGRQGEIRDRTTEGQHYRIAGLNLFAAIIIHWNTGRLGEAVDGRQRDRLPVPTELLGHISPLGWGHTLMTGEYRWRKRD